MSAATSDSDSTSDPPLPPIRLIPFAALVNLGTIPRFPENQDITVDSASIDRRTSLVVFKSHCWLRGYPGAEGYDTRPHPDNVHNEKFALMVKGIEMIWKRFAPGMTECYVWIDYGCINQDGDPLRRPHPFVTR